MFGCCNRATASASMRKRARSRGPACPPASTRENSPVGETESGKEHSTRTVLRQVTKSGGSDRLPPHATSLIAMQEIKLKAKNEFKTCKIGRLSCVAGAELPKRYVFA